MNIDTWVVIDATTRELYTTLYTKPTDTHDYLHYSSALPSHTKRAGPRGQLLRVRRICTKDEDYDIHSQQMVRHYVRRGYPLKYIEPHISTIRAMTQESLLVVKPKDQSKTNRLFFITTYNPRNIDFKKMIKDAWPLLELSELCSELFQELPIFGTRRPRNLRDTLTRSSIRYPPLLPDQGRIVGHVYEECTKADCHWCICNNSINGWIRCKSLAQRPTYRIASDTTCLTENLVYCINCKKCKMQYVGETKRKAIIRWKEHDADIRLGRDTPVANHFRLAGHSNRDMSPVIVEVISMDPDLDKTTLHRRWREKVWMFRLRCLAPKGINVKTW